MIQNLIHIKQSIEANLVFVIESVFTWYLFCVVKVVSLVVEQPFILDILPYIQLLVYILAGATSLLTMYKIKKDLKK